MRAGERAEDRARGDEQVVLHRCGSLSQAERLLIGRIDALAAVERPASFR